MELTADWRHQHSSLLLDNKNNHICPLHTLDSIPRVKILFSTEYFSSHCMQKVRKNKKKALADFFCSAQHVLQWFNLITFYKQNHKKIFLKYIFGKIWLIKYAKCLHIFPARLNNKVVIKNCIKINCIYFTHLP